MWTVERATIGVAQPLLVVIRLPHDVELCAILLGVNSVRVGSRAAMLRLITHHELHVVLNKQVVYYARL